MADAVGAIAAREGDRDAGLRRGIGSIGLAAAIVNITVGAGIFSLPSGMAKAAGPYALLAYLLCAVAMAAVVLCCAEAGSRVPTSGGIYGYVEAAFGPLAGFNAGMLVWVGSVLASGGITAAVAGAVAHLWPALASPVPRALFIVASVTPILVMNCLDVRAATRIISVATAVKLVPLVLFVGVGLLFFDPHRFVASAGVAPISGIGRAILLALFAFQGMETVLAANGEVKTPGRTLPRALIGAMAFIAVLYISIQVIAQGLLGSDLAGSAAPLADALARIDPRLGLVILIGTVISMYAWIGSDVLGASRVLFAFSRDGFLPKVVGRLSGRSQAPVVAVLVHGGLVMLLAISGTFEQLAVLSALAACLLYIGACAAAWRLSRSGVALADKPLGMPGIGIWAGLGVVSMAAAIAVAKPVEIAGLAAATVVTCALYWIARRARPAPST
ncbi:amino acid permease [soil metagenome]